MPSARDSSPAPAKDTRPEAVIVREGETLRSIAKRWGTDVPTLMMLNNLVSEGVSPGWRIKLPPAQKR